MTNPPILVITGLGGYFILNFLQKSGYKFGVKKVKDNYDKINKAEGVIMVILYYRQIGFVLIKLN